MTSNDLHPDLYGWWRITETSQWANKSLDTLGPAMISITGHAAFNYPHFPLTAIAPNVRSVRRDIPLQITIFPGGGSLARAR